MYLAFKMVKLGVSWKTALGKDCSLISDFNWILIRFPFPSSFLPRKNDKQGDKDHLRDWLAKREGAGEPEALLKDQIEWLQLLHLMLSQHLGRTIGVCVEILHQTLQGCFGWTMAKRFVQQLLVSSSDFAKLPHLSSLEAQEFLCGNNNLIPLLYPYPLSRVLPS